MTELLLAIVVVALAAHRAARAITTDTISDRPRAWVYDHAFHHPALEPAESFDWNHAAQVEAGIIPAPEERVAPEPQTVSTLWAYVYGLLSCPHCSGFWISIVLWWGWREVDDLRVWIAAGAVAGLQSVISAKGMG
jgi:hypothetical protein